MSGNLFLVTGASDGIGKATALALAQSGAAVILHGRDADKTSAALADIQSATANTKLHTLIAVFAALDQSPNLPSRSTATSVN